jgi:hypothetical protein
MLIQCLCAYEVITFAVCQHVVYMYVRKHAFPANGVCHLSLGLGDKQCMTGVLPWLAAS